MNETGNITYQAAAAANVVVTAQRAILMGIIIGKYIKFRS